MERNFAALATDLGAVARKTARLRDKGDRLVKTLQDFASNESGGTKDSLEGMAECLSALENCQQLKVIPMKQHFSPCCHEMCLFVCLFVLCVFYFHKQLV